MTIERNEPCPCGSGRKAKKCCLAAATLAPTDWSATRDRLLQRLILEAEACLDDIAWDEAIEEYAPVLPPGLPAEAEVSSMLAWLVMTWRPRSDGRVPAGLRVGESFAERALRKDRTLRPDERRLIEATLREPASWWQVEAASDTGLHLRDAFRGMTRHYDTSARDVPPGSILHGRFVEIDGSVIPMEMCPMMIAPADAGRAERVRTHMHVTAPVDDALLIEDETMLRLSFMVGAMPPSDAEVDHRLAFACIDPGADGTESMLARLTTGLEHDVQLAMRVLDEGGLRWRFVDPSTGLPGADGALITRRGALIELRATEALDDFEPLLATVSAQLAGSSARVLDPDDALRHVLEGLVPEQSPSPERALLRRLIAIERAAWGDHGFARQIKEPGYPAGIVLPLPEQIALFALRHVTLDGPSFTPGDDSPPDWLSAEPAATHARRCGLLSPAEDELLTQLVDTHARPWRVVEVLAAQRVRIVDAQGDAGATDAVVATLPAALPLAPGDLLGGMLVMSLGTDARFLVVEPIGDLLEHPLVSRLLSNDDQLEWLHEAVGLREFKKHHDCLDAEEVYRVMRPHELLAAIPSDEDDDSDDDADDFDDDDGSDAPLHVASWRIERDASGVITAAEGECEGEVNLAFSVATLRLRGDEFRLTCTDPGALSAWRADLAELAGRLGVALTWLRQERRFD